MSLRIQPQACTTPKIRQEVKDSVCLIGRPQRSLASREALLSKSSEGRADAICSSFYNTGTVTGVPSRVKRFSTAARTYNSAT